ncbi:MAG: hypothetical protein KBG15_03710 [Kofleriaceae bacterium]|nr:hypothetical protein [Kofleriaceae bacterium]
MALGLSGVDPTLSSDGGELWFTTVGTPAALVVSSRVESTYPAAVPPNFGSPQGDFDAALTADDQLLAYASNRSGFGVYQRQRGNGPGVWQNETLAVSTSFTGFDMSPDGLTLYLLENGKLRIMKRASRSVKFVSSNILSQQFATDAEYPTVSFDEREIIFSVRNGTGGILLMHAVRAANAIDYGAATALNFGCTDTSDADFSHDAMAIVYSCDGQIFIAQR